MKVRLNKSLNTYQKKLTDNYLKVELIFKENNQIIITNYNNIKSIENDCIIIDDIEIVGNDLRIISLDDYQVQIQGLVKEVICLEK